jgi:hypothetical protein
MKIKSMGAIFIVLIGILAINPKVIHDMYSSLLGRICLVGIVIFFAMNNTTLGLLVALAIIAVSNQFTPFVEGMETQATTVGEDNTSTNGQTVLTNSAVESAKKTINDLKQEINNGTNGIDKEDIKAAIMSKNSKTIPVSENMTSSTEVSPSISSMLTPSSLEEFTSYATVSN